MRIDLHIHTSHRSDCSYIDTRELIREAKNLNLDGICINENKVLWETADVR